MKIHYITMKPVTKNNELDYTVIATGYFESNDRHAASQFGKRCNDWLAEGYVVTSAPFNPQYVAGHVAQALGAV